MVYTPPLIEYKSIRVGNNTVSIGSQAKASFMDTHNKIELIFTPTNCSISQFDIRATKIDEPYGLDKGYLIRRETNIAKGAEKSIYILCSSTNFPDGSGSYRIGLYARSAVDQSWDVTYLFCTVDEKDFILPGGLSFEVLTSEDVS